MPTYNFVCETCGSKFEKFMRFSESLLTVECPNHHTQVRRVFSAPAVVFKGKGFYVTDSRKPVNEASSS
jgi:putative FmdB family regulatory protein